MRLLVDNHKISNQKIEKVLVHQPSLFAKNFIAYPPSTSVDTASSLKYLVAAYLFTRKISVEWYEAYEKYIVSDDFQSIARKIEIIEDDDLQKLFDDENIVRGKVVIHTSDGVLEKELNLEDLKGNPRNNPMSMDDIKEKFVNLSLPVIGKAKTHQFLGLLNKDDYSMTVSELTKFLRK